uniref:Lin1244/Lin1753-like N-terminal domain-containing protein n=1 Tax=viral metagenome TaxID=1070528 RepID=A0A6M3XP84_9ZZZZ
MGRDPAFLFYPGDWLGGTMTMTRSHKGAYMDLLMAQFNSGRLSIDEIKTVLGQDYESMWNVILKKKFLVDGTGLFYNEKLDNEVTKRRKYTEGRRENLKGESKPHVAPHMDKHMENGNEDRNRDIIKDEDKIREIVTEFYKYQKAQFSDLVKVDDKKINDGILVIDKLMRIDNFKLEVVTEVLKFIVNDSFWARQVLSLNGLRVKKPNGNTKFVNALLKSKDIGKSNVSKHNQSVIDEWIKSKENDNEG